MSVAEPHEVTPGYLKTYLSLILQNVFYVLSFQPVVNVSLFQAIQIRYALNGFVMCTSERPSVIAERVAEFSISVSMSSLRLVLVIFWQILVRQS